MTKPLRLQASRMWYRVCIGFTGSNDLLVAFISATAIASSGLLIQENKTNADYFAEWEFPTIHNAARVVRTLDGFEPPAWADTSAAWGEALLSLYISMLERTLTTFGEDQAKVQKETIWTQ